MCGLVLVPQQQSRDTGTSKLRVDRGEVRLRATRCGYFVRIELRFKRAVVERFRRRPNDPRFTGAAQTLWHRRARSAAERVNDFETPGFKRLVSNRV